MHAPVPSLAHMLGTCMCGRNAGLFPHPHLQQHPHGQLRCQVTPHRLHKRRHLLPCRSQCPLLSLWRQEERSPCAGAGADASGVLVGSSGGSTIASNGHRPLQAQRRFAATQKQHEHHDCGKEGAAGRQRLGAYPPAGRSCDLKPVVPSLQTCSHRLERDAQGPAPKDAAKPGRALPALVCRRQHRSRTPRSCSCLVCVGAENEIRPRG